MRDNLLVVVEVHVRKRRVLLLERDAVDARQLAREEARRLAPLDLHVLRVHADPTTGGITAAWTQVLTGNPRPSPRCGHRMLLADLAQTDASLCRVEGSGLAQCIVGSEASFRVVAYDGSGARRWCGRDDMQAVIRGPFPHGYDEATKDERRRKRGQAWAFRATAELRG